MTSWWEADDRDRLEQDADGGDYLAQVCAENYSGRGVFDGAGWPGIAIAVAREIVGGQDWPEYMGQFLTRREAVVVETDLLESLTDVTSRRLVAAAVVAPAVQRLAATAAADHWTPNELLAGVRRIVNEQRPRLEWLATDPPGPVTGRRPSI